MRDSLNYFGANFSWFNGTGPVNLRLEDCRFEAYNLNLNSMTFLYEFGPLAGPQFSARNTVFSFDGPRAGRLGRPVDARWSHNAYKFSGGASDDVSADPGAVLLLRTPPDATPPSLTGPLAGAGVDNGVTYDRTGAPRPAGRFDIGPVAARPLPAPQAVAFTWGGRTAAVTDGGGVGWSGVRSVAFTFAADVDVNRQALTVVGTLGGAYSVTAFTYDPQARRAVWTLATPVTQDRLTFFLDGVAAFRQTVLAGDVDGDGTVNAADYGLFRVALGSTDARFDVDGSGVVDAADVAAVRQYYGTSV
jgi:hypothetical protein